MAKTYYKTDKDGMWRVIEQDNGVTASILEKPSDAYIAALQPGQPEIQERNPIPEIDALIKRIVQLEKSLHPTP